jgi:hemerythrin superfamily protein
MTANLAPYRAVVPCISHIPIGVQTTSPFSTSSKLDKTVSDAIKHDHRELETYYNEIMNAKDAETATKWQNQFVWELARHSIAEELVVYPAMEKHLGQEGKALADKDRAEHNQLKLDLAKFQKLSATDPAFKTTLGVLYKDLQGHIAEEEQHDLPKLESAIKSDTEKMAASFERTKMFVPTRSHPSAPDKPPFETVVGLMTAPIDKLMDMFHKFPTTEEKQKVMNK